MPKRVRTGTWTPAPPVNVHPDTEVWTIPYTGEAFTDYSQYVEAVTLYNKRDWVCDMTTRKGLNLEEALLSEKFNGFPETHKAATLKAAHCNTSALLKIVADLYEVFKTEFMPGETTVQWKLANRRKQASAPFVTIVEKADKKEYIVIDKKTGKKQCVGADKLYRKQPPLLKDAVKQYIRDSTTRDGYKEAPFLVKPELVARYNLTTKLTKAMKVAQDDYRVRAKKMAATQAIADGDAAAIAAAAAKAKADAVPKVRIRYPIDDALLTSKDRQDEGPWVTPSYTFAVPEDVVREALPIWDFLVAFGEQIDLTEFNFQQFQYGLLNCGETESTSKAKAKKSASGGGNSMFAHSVIALLTAAASASQILTGVYDADDAAPSRSRSRSRSRNRPFGYRSRNRNRGKFAAAAVPAAAADDSSGGGGGDGEGMAVDKRKAGGDALDDAVRKPYECEFGCGFDGETEAIVETHEKKCARNPKKAKKGKKGKKGAGKDDAVDDDIRKPYECEFGCGFDGETEAIVETHETKCPKNPKVVKAKAAAEAKAKAEAEKAASAAAAAAAPPTPSRVNVGVTMANWEAKVRPWLGIEIERSGKRIPGAAVELDEIKRYCSGGCTIERVSVKAKLLMLRMLSDAAVASARIHEVLSTNVEDVRLLKVEQRQIKLEYNIKKRAEKEAARVKAAEEAAEDAARKAEVLAKRIANGETEEEIAAADAAAAEAKVLAEQAAEEQEAKLDDDERDSKKFGVPMPVLPTPAELEGREGRRRLGDYNKDLKKFQDTLAKYRFEAEREEKKQQQSVAKEAKAEKARIDAENEEYNSEYNAISLEILQTSLLRRVPLGKDRSNNHYWVFWHDPSRIFIQEALPADVTLADEGGEERIEPMTAGECAGSTGRWGVYTTISELDDLCDYLNEKGIHEKELKKGFEDYYSVIVDAMKLRAREERKHAKLEDGTNMAAEYKNELYEE